jgi:hypothetical protein
VTANSTCFPPRHTSTLPRFMPCNHNHIRACTTCIRVMVSEQTVDCVGVLDLFSKLGIQYPVGLTIDLSSSKTLFSSVGSHLLNHGCVLCYPACCSLCVSCLGLFGCILFWSRDALHCGLDFASLTLFWTLLCALFYARHRPHHNADIIPTQQHPQ